MARLGGVLEQWHEDGLGASGAGAGKRGGRERG